MNFFSYINTIYGHVTDNWKLIEKIITLFFDKDFCYDLLSNILENQIPNACFAVEIYNIDMNNYHMQKKSHP